MNSKFYLKPNNTDNVSNFDKLTDNDEYEEELFMKKYSKSNKNVEIAQLRNLPSVFFMCFLIVFSLITVKFMIVSFSLKKTNLYLSKYDFHYYSQFFSEQGSLTKMLIVGSQFLFLIIIFFFFTLMKQRISVPELNQERWKNYLCLLMSFGSIATVICLTFFSNETLNFTKNKLAMVDNIVFLIYLITSFMFCLLSFLVLSKINCSELSKDKKYLFVKKVLLIIMFLQLFLYVISLILISAYHPKIYLEELLTSMLMVSMTLNSMTFIFCKMFFIWTLKYDLYYVTMNLQILPDIEYFIDLEENAKLTL